MFVRLLAVTLLLLFTGAAVAPAQLDSRFDADVRIDGASALDLAGLGVAGAGDVNGDGIPDLVVGASGASHRNRRQAGAAYVVFGSREPERLDLDSLATRGFRIDGATKGDHLGLSVAGVGDVNRDGLADVAVSALDANVTGRRDAGAAYVVFGKRDVASVDLAKLGRGGFRILPGPPESFVGEVAAAGDVNRDRVPDVIVGAELEGTDDELSGWAWVVFGKRDSRTVDLARLGRRGLLIEGPAERSETKVVSGVGDFDRDGYGDVAVGAPRADVGEREGAGRVYVVFGRRRGGTVDVTKRGAARGLTGERAKDALGSALAGGRVNGDRRGDVVVGASGLDPRGRTDAGGAYVIFGGSRRRAVLYGARSHDRAGDAVAFVGDVQGDGRGDVAVGASRADANGLEDSGSAFVVTGARRGERIDLRLLGERGVRVDGGDPDDGLGVSLAGAGDLSGDGLSDILLGAFGTTSFERTSSGAAYVVFGPLGANER